MTRLFVKKITNYNFSRANLNFPAWLHEIPSGRNYAYPWYPPSQGKRHKKLFQRIPFQLPGVFAFQVRKLTTLSAALQINPRLRCIRNPSFGIQTSNLGHIKHRLPRIHLHGIQALKSKLQGSESKPAPASSTLHASFVTSTSTEFMHRISVTSNLHAKLQFSATSTLPPLPIGSVWCARWAITFVLYTFVANHGREWESARAPTERAHRFVANEIVTFFANEIVDQQWL